MFRAFVAGRVQDLQSIVDRQNQRNVPVVNARVCAQSGFQTAVHVSQVQRNWFIAWPAFFSALSLNQAEPFEHTRIRTSHDEVYLNICHKQ